MKHLLCLTALVAASTVRADVVINEIHYNPGAGLDDANYEWFELHNTGGSSVDLSGWSITDDVPAGHSAVTHTFAGGTTIAAGGYLVVGSNPSAVESFYGISGVILWDSGALDNGDDPIVLRDAATTIVDQVYYLDDSGWPTACDGDGPSLELINPELDNDNFAAWDASAVDHGTPGAANSVYTSDAEPVAGNLFHSPQNPGTGQIVTINVDVTDDQGVSQVLLRFNPGTSDQAVLMSNGGSGDTWTGFIGPFAEGSLVSVAIEVTDSGNQTVTYPGQLNTDDSYFFYVTDSPLADGDLVFSEFQYTDACFGNLDWVELYNNTAAAIELGSFQFKDDQDDHIFEIPGGTTIDAGAYLVLAQDAAQLTLDYGVTNVVGDIENGLGSGGDALRLFDINGNLLDAVYYEVGVNDWPDGTVGNSVSLIDVSSDNSLGASWELSTAPCGSPGVANDVDIFAPSVLSAGVINDTTIELSFDEEMDPVTAETLSNYSLSGNACTSASLVDPMTVELQFGIPIGLGYYVLHVENVEDLAGNAVPASDISIAYATADAVVITEILQNPSVDDDFGEWFELYNPGASPVNLRGWILRDYDTDSHVISPDADLFVMPGEFFVLGRSGDTTFNGDYAPDYVYGDEFQLANGADEIQLLAGLTVIDECAYDGGSEWPDPNGISMELMAIGLDNNVGANWGEATTAFGLGDLGTPGAFNSIWSLEAPVLTITFSDPDIELDWNAVPFAADYQVLVSDGLGLPFSELAVTTDTFYSFPAGPAGSVKLYQVLPRQ